MKILRGFLKTVAIVIGLWLVLEVGLRVYVEHPLKTDFYGSIPRAQVREYQRTYGVQVAAGPGWAHLGWVADPDHESYRIKQYNGGVWQEVGRARFGSYVIRGEGRLYRVMAYPMQEGATRLIGEAKAVPGSGTSPICAPEIAGPWRPVFRPSIYGSYINDHAFYQDAQGSWRLVGITSKSDGDFNAEKQFAVGLSRDFPPQVQMQEEGLVADFGELAWAPHVVVDKGIYSIFWSPHRLKRMISHDGITWEKKETVMHAPYHKFFRDAMVFKVTDGQWLLYATARGKFFSQVDLYQSFDLTGWQYIGTALDTGIGSERNSPFASTESPFVMHYRGRYYLSVTYNNDTFAWNGILMLFKIWLDRDSYNDTLVFHADNPYDFGMYRGRSHAPTLVAELKAHAPEYIYLPEHNAWYITTAGWPWVATLTRGEVAIAPLRWGYPKPSFSRSSSSKPK